MKKLTALFLALILILSFSACGKAIPAYDSLNGSKEQFTESTTKQSKQETESKTPKFDIDDIDWNIKEGIVDGERYLVMSYVNNTKFAIVDFNIHFTEKDNLSEAEKDAYLNDIIDEFGFDDESEEDIAQFKATKIGMSAESEKLIYPKESIENIHVHYYNGYYYVKNDAHFDLVTPDIATVKFISDGKLYTVYYDFNSGDYSYDNKIENANYWTEFEIGNMVPKPDAEIILEYNIETEKIFIFTVLGVDEQDYLSYVEQLRNAGFTEGKYVTDDYFSADNAEGYSISIDFNEDECSYKVTTYAP